MRVLVLLLALLGPAPAAARDYHALLIGVQDYPALPEYDRLLGPANDVELVRTYLLTQAPVPFSPGRITVLSDGVPGSRPATLQAIRNEMAALASRLAPGDFVYLHFSGHGSQAPAIGTDPEPDGLDELFLPYDIGPWSFETGDVRNALRDDEIGAMLDRLRAAGADVWVVFDSCHSGSATRGAPRSDDIRSRRVDAQALGIPDAAFDDLPLAPPPEPMFDPAPADGHGSLTAFFAARTSETTPEMNMPAGITPRQPHGVFTFTLFQALAANPGGSYRDLAQDLQRRYTVFNLAAASPTFGGDLDASIFGAGDADPVRQWPLLTEGGAPAIPAGTLHGLAPGTELTLHDSPLSDRVLGTATVASATPFRAMLDVPAGLPRGTHARRPGLDVPFTIRLALPETGDTALANALFAADPRLGARLVFTAPGAPADLRLLRDEGRLTLLPGAGQPRASGAARLPSVPAGLPPDRAAATLAPEIDRMARGLNLMRVAEALDGDLPGLELALSMQDPADPGLHPLDTAARTRLQPDDQVWISARNAGDRPVDIDVLYVQADYTISHMAAFRLEPGDAQTRGLFYILPGSYGIERVVISAVASDPRRLHDTLAFLATDNLGLTRAPGAGDLGDLLAEAGFGGTLRSGGAEIGTGEARMRLIPLETVPAR